MMSISRGKQMVGLNYFTVEWNLIINTIPGTGENHIISKVTLLVYYYYCEHKTRFNCII